MQSMLVNEEQLILGLHQDVGIRKLRQRFHVWEFIQFALERFLITGTCRVATACMPMQVAFCR